MNNNNNNNLINEIYKLKDYKIKAKKFIDEQNIKIKELENQLANNNYIKLEKEMKLKDKEINQLKAKILKLKETNKDHSDNKEEKFSRKEMKCVYFTSVDQKINYPIPCIDSDIFAEVEEKLYKEYPEYRERNNCFIANGKEILRFKSIADNKIGNGMPVILYEPEK